MLELEINRKAAADIDAILDYSLSEFGPSVAGRYREAMFRAIARAQKRPEDGKQVAKRPGMFRLSFRKHVIFYRVKDNTLSLIRVLHQRMNPDRHL